VSDVIDEHRTYLADDARLAAYRRAIEARVRPGDVVVDLGAGTGILGLLACRAGARRVYAIEQTGLVEIARAIARANGFLDRIVHIEGLSTQVEIPEPANVVVCDQIGRFGFEAGLFEYFVDASRRYLAEGGFLIPGHIRFELAAVELGERAADVSFWERGASGFNLQPLGEIARNSGYPADLHANHLLSAPAALARASTRERGPFEGNATVEVTRAGEMHGLGAWFVAELAPGVEMTNSPLASERVRRHNTFLPIEKPIEVEPGDRVHLHVHIIPGETMLSWSVSVRRGREGWEENTAELLSSRHSTFRGMLFSRNRLRRTQPEFRPRLSEWGKARSAVLALCDGERTLASIEHELLSRYSGLFGSRRDASRFVAEVVTRYAL
jgi:protein arginine N-methyltransferase 1